MTTRSLLRSAVFLAALIALDQGLGAGLGSLLARARSGQGAGLVQRALQARDAGILVFGSSRAQRHVDPAALERGLGLSAHNAGCPGQALAYARMLEALVLARGSRARLFVLQIDPKHLFVDRSARASVFAPFYGESAAVDQILAADRFAALKLQSRSYRFNSLALGLLRAVALPGAEADGNGFTPHRGRMGRAAAGAAPDAFAPPRTADGRYPFLPRMRQMLRDFVADARARGIDVFVFLGPRYRGAARTPNWELAARAELGRVVASAGGAYAPVDEIAQPELRQPALYFNRSHLNEQGAAVLSALLVREIRTAFPQLAGN